MPAPMKPAPTTPTFFRFVGGTSFGPARALVQILHRDEERADHRRRFLRAQDLGELARLDLRAPDRSAAAGPDRPLRESRGRRDNCPASRGGRWRWPAARSACRRANRPCPTGSLKPFASQGAFGGAAALIQSFAASTIGRAARPRATRPMLARLSGRICSPLNSICSASPVCIRRATRCVPPAPGKSPTLISGRPTRVASRPTTTRWWQASASSKAPPRQTPSIAAANGLPQVSSRR